MLGPITVVSLLSYYLSYMRTLVADGFHLAAEKGSTLCTPQVQGPPVSTECRIRIKVD